MEGSEGHSPVSKVATDCKAGVKFDLAGHEATERLRRAESFNSFSSFGMRTTSQFRFNAGLFVLCQLLWNSPKVSKAYKIRIVMRSITKHWGVSYES